MPNAYTRNQAGEDYVTKARFGPVGKDIARRTILINIDAMRRAPIGEGRAPDAWQPGYPPGGLKRSIHSYVEDRPAGPTGVITADARRPGEATSYAESVHEGSQAHGILPKRVRLLRWPGTNGDVFAAAVHHPGNRRPKPFLRDALEAGRG